MHLAEEDLEEGSGATTHDVVQGSWLSRYPEISGVINKIIPGLIPEASPIKRLQRKSRKIMPREAQPLKLYARPHEMFVTKVIEDTQEYIRARVLHINPAGPLARLDMERANGVLIQAEILKDVIDKQGINKGDTIFVRPKATKVFG